MQSLKNLTAVVTGASGGLGNAVAVALAAEGAKLHLNGRDDERLNAVADACRGKSPYVAVYPADIGIDSEITAFTRRLHGECDTVDVLVHCAGVVFTGSVAESAVALFDEQFRTNLRAPYVITQALLPKLIAGNGQIVFVNSSVGLAARADISQYAATKHGLRALADGLRAEVNADGVRVLSVYLGRTATRSQERLHRAEGKDYLPGRLIQPEDVAYAIVAALKADRTAEITDIHVRPMKKT